MSLRAITGKPGGGKSNFGVSKMLEELRVGVRRCYVSSKAGVSVSNTRLYLLNEYGSDFDIGRRLVILDEEQEREFWKHIKSTKYWVAHPETNEPAELKVAGCFILLDEVHRIFPSAESANPASRKLRLEMTDFLSTHRHMGHDVYYMTQHLKLLDKNWERLTQDFIETRNIGNEKWGWFRPKPKFEVAVFLQPPYQANVRAIETYDLKLDVKGICSCYDTSAADKDTFTLNNADKNARKPGLPLWSLSVFIVTGLIILVCVLKFGTKSVDIGVKHFTGQFGKRAPEKRESSTNEVGRIQGVVNSASDRIRAALNERSDTYQPSPVVPGSLEKKKEIHLTGISLINDTINIFLSNGQRFTSHDPRVQVVGRDYVVISGERFEFASLAGSER